MGKVALSMLAEGAEGETKAEFADALNGCLFKAEDLGGGDPIVGLFTSTCVM